MAKVKAQAPSITPMKKKTSQSGKSSMLKMASMNKSAKRSHKAYRGQGR